MTSAEREQRFSKVANQIVGIDLEVYETFNKDPLIPIIGKGPKAAGVAIFGRDPGREEVRHGMPFIGAGGQKVRAVIHQALFGVEMPDFDASVKAGSSFFWANTVPYKPVGNKAWSQKVKKQFRDLMAEILLLEWDGDRVITLGREAFLWFGLGADREERARMDTFWKSENRFEEVFTCPFSLGDVSRNLYLYPLPHPSPLNATWYKRFDGLLAARLEQLRPWLVSGASC